MLCDMKPKQAQVRKAEQRKDTPFTVLEFSTKAEMLDWKREFVANADAATAYRLKKHKHTAEQLLSEAGCVLRFVPLGEIDVPVVWPYYPGMGVMGSQHNYKLKYKWIFFKEIKCVHCGHKV